MKSEKLFGTLFLLIGIFLFVLFSDLLYFENFLIPAIFFVIVGYSASVKFFSENSAFVFAVSVGLFLAGVALLVESLFNIRHYNQFVAFAFFVSIALIFFTLYLRNRAHVFYFPFVALFAFLGYVFPFLFPSQFLHTFVKSVNNILSVTPFVFLLVGIKLNKE